MFTRRLFIDPIGDELALSDSARTHLERLDGQLPDKQFLAELSTNDEANLASRVLYESLLRDSRHGEFQRKVDGSPTRPTRKTSAPLIVIVPGMFYREYPEIGADGSLVVDIARRFGAETVTVPSLSLGSVSENRDILHEYLRNMPARPFWLISMSRGSAEVKWMLQSHSDASYLDQLQGWISVCGIVSGTPLHERIYKSRILSALHRTFARVNGIDADLGAELCRSNELWQPTQCPEHIQIVNIIAIPLSWHVTGSAMRRYKRICHLGPNDGVVLLGDYLNEPGLIYPVWGVDHFMRTSRLGEILGRLFCHLLVRNGEVYENSGDCTANNDSHGLDRDGAGSSYGRSAGVAADHVGGRGRA